MPQEVPEEVDSLEGLVVVSECRGSVRLRAVPSRSCCAFARLLENWAPQLGLAFLFFLYIKEELGEPKILK